MFLRPFGSKRLRESSVFKITLSMNMLICYYVNMLLCLLKNTLSKICYYVTMSLKKYYVFK